MPHNPFALLLSTISAISFGIIRLLSTSGISWVRAMIQPYTSLEYPFLFFAIFLGIHGWTGWSRLALLFALLITFGFYIVATGAGF